MDTVLEVDKEMVDYMDVAPRQLISVPTSLIPFLENDDTARALMGANMQRQAVPLIRTEEPIVATGMEHKIALDNCAIIVSKNAGTVTYVDANNIEVTADNGEVDKYELTNKDIMDNSLAFLLVSENYEKCKNCQGFEHLHLFQLKTILIFHLQNLYKHINFFLPYIYKL